MTNFESKVPITQKQFPPDYEKWCLDRTQTAHQLNEILHHGHMIRGHGFYDKDTAEGRELGSLNAIIEIFANQSFSRADLVGIGEGPSAEIALDRAIESYQNPDGVTDTGPHFVPDRVPTEPDGTASEFDNYVKRQGVLLRKDARNESIVGEIRHPARGEEKTTLCGQEVLKMMELPVEISETADEAARRDNLQSLGISALSSWPTLIEAAPKEGRQNLTVVSAVEPSQKAA